MGMLTDRRRPVLVPPPIEEEESTRIRVWLLGLFSLALFAVLTVQLVRLQVFRHEEFEALATINRIRNENLPAERGLIFDRNGNPLVENVPAFAISVVPADVPDGEEMRVATVLAEALGVSVFSIEEQLLAGKRSIDPFFPRLLEANADAELAFTLSALGSDLPGVQVKAVANRLYQEGDLLGHILGYVGPITAEEFSVLEADRYRISDRLGQTGVESYYESVLRGTPGQRQFEVNAGGRELRTLRFEDPTPGSGIQLTIDLELQAAVRDILLESLRGSSFASAVVVDVNTGEILAMVSVPSYDPNVFTGEVDEEALEALLEGTGPPAGESRDRRPVRVGVNLQGGDGDSGAERERDRRAGGDLLAGGDRGAERDRPAHRVHVPGHDERQFRLRTRDGGVVQRVLLVPIGGVAVPGAGAGGVADAGGFGGGSSGWRTRG